MFRKDIGFPLNIDVVILAAGQGSRMRSNKPKVLHAIGGKPMVQHVIDAAKALGDVNVHIVVGHGADQVQANLGADSLYSDCQYIEQVEQLGTAHAVLQVLPALTPGSKTLILYGDVPLIKTETLRAMLEAVNETSMAVLTASLDDATGYGRIVRNDNNEVLSIVEHKDAKTDQLAINEINTGIMCIPQSCLAKWLPNIGNDNAQKEYYLPDVIAMSVTDGVGINTPSPQSLFEIQGVNNRLQLAELEREFQREQANKLMVEGATLADPARIDVRGNVTVGQDVFIDINAVLQGDVVIGANVSIGPNCVITNASIAEGSNILANSVIEDAVIGKDCNIGPFARLRPGANLADGCKVGNFVEIKNAQLGDGSKVNHLSYVGDAEIGTDTNIGAGTITCNYDGANKFKTVMGNNVFVGSNSTLVAPVEIADGGFVAAGSTVTQTVPADNLAVGRGRQRNITGWKKPVKKKS